MTYNNSKPVSGFSIVSRSATVSSQQRLAKCMTKAGSGGHVTTSTCYTATVAQLSRHQLIFIENSESYHRPIITSRQFSFWGIYKINW